VSVYVICVYSSNHLKIYIAHILFKSFIIFVKVFLSGFFNHFYFLLYHYIIFSASFFCYCLMFLKNTKKPFDAFCENDTLYVKKISIHFIKVFYFRFFYLFGCIDKFCFLVYYIYEKHKRIF